MVSSNDDIETVAAEIERMRMEQPHLDSLLKALGPLILAKNRWLNDVREYTKDFRLIRSNTWVGSRSASNAGFSFLRTPGRVRAWQSPRPSARDFPILPKIWQAWRSRSKAAALIAFP